MKAEYIEYMKWWEYAGDDVEPACALMENTSQLERIFFGPEDEYERAELKEKHKKKLVSRQYGPFSQFIGNIKAVRKLQAAAYVALGNYNHEMRDLAFAMFGPSSVGKTTLVRIYAEVVELPFIEASPKSIRKVNDLFKLIQQVLRDENLPLEPDEKGQYTLPPCVIFIDEVHALTDSVVQGLLKATEFNDSVMVTENGTIINTRHVTWAIATTDEGKLFDAFRTRFSSIQLTYLTKAEVAKIVQLANPDFPPEVCELIAYYNSRVPRKALEFARYMKLVQQMDKTSDWESVAKRVASDEGIDEFGMQNVHLKLLKALGQSPIAKNRIALIAGKKEEEVETYILPWLLIETEDQPALVGVSSRGFVITEAGLKELERRGIPHQGSKVVLEG